MITEQDLTAAIAECKGKRNPDSNTCIKLAAYYIVKEHLYPSNEEVGYSYSAPPEYDSGTEFSNAVSGVDKESVYAIMDETMTALSVLSPNLYASVMRKLRDCR